VTTYGYGDTPEDIQRRMADYLPTERKRPVAVSIDGGPLVFGLLYIDFEVREAHVASTGETYLRRGRYTWWVEVEASPVPGVVELAMGDIHSQTLTGRAKQQSITAERDQRMWTTYTAASELGGYEFEKPEPMRIVW
jgi:hypothetical protein